MKNRRLHIGLLFLLSGCAALVYEVVWFQLLKLTIGSSALSIGITVATFMGGMCLGSYFFHRVVPDRWHPLLLYAVLEAGIALFGVINLFAIPKIAEIYFSFAGYGAGGIAAGAARLIRWLTEHHARFSNTRGPPPWGPLRPVGVQSARSHPTR